MATENTEEVRVESLYPALERVRERERGRERERKYFFP